MTFHEPIPPLGPCPPDSGRSKRAKDGAGWTLPEGAEASSCRAAVLGDVHHRLHDPDRAGGRLVHVPVP